MGAAATGSDGGSDRQQWQQRGAVKAPATARAVGTVAGRTWRHLGSFLVLLGLTWCHSVARGVTRFHSDLVLRHLVSLGVTWCHLVSHGFTWCHLVSLRPHSVSLGVTWCHLVTLSCHSVLLGVTWFRRNRVLVDSRVRSRMTCVRSGVLRRSDGVFFLPSEKKKTAWRHLDTFFCQKTGFPGSCCRTNRGAS